MSEQRIRTQRRGRITLVTLDRPNVLNALDTQAHEELEQAFDDFAADPEQWVAIITGAGSAFCAGHDLRSPAPRGPDDFPPGGFGALTARFDLDKPIIAAVNGLAFGGGLEIALACDLIIAGRGARFALPEVKVGMAALGGGILRLSRQVGEKRAMGMMLTGRPVDAAEALDLGFVTDLVEDEDVLPAAFRWAEMIMAASPTAVRATKQVAKRLASAPLDQAMFAQWALAEVITMQGSQDAAEGSRAFLERRSPIWKGR